MSANKDSAIPEVSVSDAAQVADKGTSGWIVFGILTVTGLGYAFAVFTAITFLASGASSSSGLSGYGWFVLIFASVFPLLVLGLVYAFGRRRSALELFLISLAGLGVAGVFWVNVLAHVIASPLLFLP